MAKELPLQRICDFLQYDQQTGHLTWKQARGKGIKSGDKAGCKTVTGYVQVYIDNKPYLAHRLVYALNTGKSIFGDVDHIDGNRSNNVFSNLREVSKAENAKNRISRGTFPVSTKWVSGLTVDYKKKHLGTFDTEEQAHEAYLAAKRLYHPQAEGRKYEKP